jgi:ATP-dependent Lon protease
MHIPDSVHVRITSETLKDYVGPPVYQKDRMYVHAPPPGISTGLGNLGNGSGAVMPVEAMVRHQQGLAVREMADLSGPVRVWRSVAHR